MLAKTWKTILLAICIIAVLFNIISKIVRTPSFQRNLDKVIEENIVTVDSSQFSNTIENAGQSLKDTASEITSALFNTTSKNTTIEDTDNTEEVVETEEENNSYVEEEQTEDYTEEPVEEENTDSKFKVSFN